MNPTERVPCLITSLDLVVYIEFVAVYPYALAHKEGKLWTFLCLYLETLKKLLHNEVDPSVSLEEPVDVLVGFYRDTGRFILVKLRFPLPLDISFVGSYTFPITLVRQPMYEISVSGFPL